MKKIDDKRDEEKWQKKVDELEKQLERIKSEAEEWKRKYLRALADYQNLEKWTQEETNKVRRFAAEIVLTKLLPIADTFKRAQAHLQDTGLSLGLKELEAFFLSQGVKKMDVTGKLFDPHEMECIEVVSGQDNTVIEEVLPGYTIHGKIIRVAQVKVGKQNLTNPTNE